MPISPFACRTPFVCIQFDLMSGPESMPRSGHGRAWSAATCIRPSDLACAMPLPQLLSLIESLGEFRELLSKLPPPANRREVGGLHGSSDAVVIASLSKYAPRRFFVVVSDDVAGAERWLADLTTLVAPDAVAFYPPRESFGEAEAHAEIAGERVETLERIGQGDLRILITTTRAL